MGTHSKPEGLRACPCTILPYSLCFIAECQKEVVYQDHSRRSVEVSCQCSAINRSVNRPSEYCQGDSYACWTSSNQISKGVSDGDKGVEAICRREERGKPEGRRRNSSGYKPKIERLLRLVTRTGRPPVQPVVKNDCRVPIIDSL